MHCFCESIRMRHVINNLFVGNIVDTFFECTWLFSRFFKLNAFVFQALIDMYFD